MFTYRYAFVDGQHAVVCNENGILVATSSTQDGAMQEVVRKNVEARVDNEGWALLHLA